MDNNNFVNEYVEAKVELEVLKYQLSLLKEALQEEEITAARRLVDYNRNHPEDKIDGIALADVSGSTIRKIFGWELSAEAKKILEEDK